MCLWRAIALQEAHRLHNTIPFPSHEDLTTADHTVEDRLTAEDLLTMEDLPIRDLTHER